MTAADIVTDIDADFAPRPRGDVIRERLASGRNRREIANDLGISLATLNEEVAQLIREHNGEAGPGEPAPADGQHGPEVSHQGRSEPG